MGIGLDYTSQELDALIPLHLIISNEDYNNMWATRID
jgi:hypothetical protein